MRTRCRSCRLAGTSVMRCVSSWSRPTVPTVRRAAGRPCGTWTTAPSSARSRKVSAEMAPGPRSLRASFRWLSGGVLLAGRVDRHDVPATAEGTPDRWQLRLWGVVLVFGAVTLVRSAQVGIPLRDPHGAILLSRLAISLVLFGVLALVDATRHTAAGRRTPRTVLETLRGRWNRRRLLQAASALLAYHLVYF